jgi:TolB-like protein
LPDIFLSYSRDDRATARRFAEGLEREGFSVWWDATLNAGEAFDEEIEKALDQAKAVVVLWSKSSVVSRWVRSEATQANDNKKLVPAMITPCKRPIMFELTHTAELSHWTGDLSDKAWQSYVASVRLLVERDRPTGGAPQIPISLLPSRRFGARSMAIVAVAVLLSGATLWAVLRRNGEPAAVIAVTKPSTPSVAMASAAVAGAPRTAIAVMSFENLTGDASKDYLGDGMAEELIGALAKVPGMQVPSRTSSFAYKGRHVDVKQIASDLHVGTILEGSVRSAGETIRISAELIDARSDTHLWSDTYDRKFTDLFKLQDDLAQSIVQALQRNLNGASPASLAKTRPTRNVMAYDLYLQAVAIANSGRMQDIGESLTLLKRSLEIDPKFAAALAVSAEVRLGYVVMGYPLPNALRDAEREATRALELDPSLPAAQHALGTINAFRGNWRAADAQFKAALSDDPTNAIGPISYANYTLESVGHLQQALEQTEEAYRLAPALPRAAIIMAVNYSIMGRDGDALKYVDTGVKLGEGSNVTPVPQIYANALARSGHYAEAADLIVGTLPAGIRAAGGDAVIREVYAALGEPRKKPAATDALQNLVRMLKPADLPVNTRKDLLALFTQLGSLDRAFTLANESVDLYAREGTVGNAWGVLWLPEMRPFRQDARFQAFVTRLKLMDYWKALGPPDGCDLKQDKLICY